MCSHVSHGLMDENRSEYFPVVVMLRSWIKPGTLLLLFVDFHFCEQNRAKTKVISDNKRPYLKLNITGEYVVSSGDNVTVLVQASDPEGKAVNVSYSVDGSIIYKPSKNLVIIGPVYDRKELIIKARDNCGLETTATAVIVTNSPYWTSTFCLDDKFGIKIKSNISFFLSITLKDPSCIARSNGADLILSTEFSECGSTKTETSDHIVVANEVKLMRATKGTVTRYNEMVIPFTCSYSRSRWTSITSFRPGFTSFIKAKESGFGNFTLSFRMARGASFDSYYSSYPVTVETNERVYFQISMASNATDAALLIEKCFVTPSKNRNDLVRYTLIENRCPKDITLQFHPGEFHHKMFSFLAFKFVSNTSMIYLHCEVFICDQASKDQRCRSGCGVNRISDKQKRDIKKSASVPEPSRNFILDNGPIQKAVNKNASGSSKSVSTTTMIMAFVVGILVLLLIGILAAKIIKSRRGKSLTENGTAAEKQGKDNEALEMQCDIH